MQPFRHKINVELILLRAGNTLSGNKENVFPAEGGMLIIRFLNRIQ